MNTVPEVYYDADASPLARVFAKTLAHALLTPEGARLLRAITIPFAIRSVNGRQAITIDPTDEGIEVKNGVARNARVILTLDLDDPSVKPVIEGLLRHPLQVMRIGQLLSLPSPSWEDSARSFWIVAGTVEGTPGRLIVTNISEGGQVTLGDDDTEGSVEIQGNTADLQSLLSGQSLLAVDAMSRKVRYHGSLKHLATLSEVGQKMLLGKDNG